jgi:hypothetical protein
MLLLTRRSAAMANVATVPRFHYTPPSQAAAITLACADLEPGADSQFPVY